MKAILHGIIICLFLSSCAASVVAAPVEVPLDQVPGHESFLVLGSQGEGIETDYSGFDASHFTQLYFGVAPNPPGEFGLPTVSYNNVPTTLTFFDVEGTTAIWKGSAVVDLASGTTTVPLQLLLTVNGLGANPWIDPASASLPIAMGAAIADPAGLNFATQTFFQADYGSGFVPVTSAPFGAAGGRVGSTISFDFFVVRPTPEPQSLALAIAALACCSAWGALRRKRSRRWRA